MSSGAAARISFIQPRGLPSRHRMCRVGYPGIRNRTKFGPVILSQVCRKGLYYWTCGDLQLRTTSKAPSARCKMCPGGGIGRHSGLQNRLLRGNCGFESHPGHSLRRGNHGLGSIPNIHILLACQGAKQRPLLSFRHNDV
jgi:hypothetical protein